MSDGESTTKGGETDNVTTNVVQMAARMKRKRDGTLVAAKPVKGRNPHTGGRAPDKLTAKQERFAFLVGHEGQTLVAAYRTAYDCSGMADKTVYNMASANAGHRGIAERIEYFKKRKEERTLHDGPALRRLVVEGLLKEAREAERAADRLKAFELIGRLTHVGAWSDTVRIEGADKPVDELMTELEAKLKALSA